MRFKYGSFIKCKTLNKIIKQAIYVKYNLIEIQTTSYNICLYKIKKYLILSH